MNHPQITISVFESDCYEKVYELWQQCEGVGLGESDSKAHIDKFLQRNPDMSFVAFCNGNLAGAVLCGHDGRRGYIHHLAVLAHYRHQGIGRQLVKRCLETLEAQCIQKCHLFIFNDNLPGIAFWESIGWSFRKDIGVVSKSIAPASQSDAC